MITKRMEKLGLDMPVLGFGCMRLPTKDGKIDREAAFAMVDYAYQNGIRYFDTAWPYHQQTSELFMGEALKRYPRESFYFTTKMPVWLANSEEELEEIFNKQLEKCQTDYFDFYLLHALNQERFEHCKKINAFAFLDRKKAEGKIRRAGFSYHDANDRYLPIVEAYPWDFAQIQYNYIDEKLTNAHELYQILADHDIPAVIMEPVRGGFLSTLPADIAKIFTQANPDRSVSSWALRWVADHENVKVVLSGMSNMEQLVDNINTFRDESYHLSAQEQQVIATVTDRLMAIPTVPCTGCRYCMDCPFGVDIPKVFSIYNNYEMFNNPQRTYNDYFVTLAPEARATSCQKCGACMTQCPQHIQIPDELEKAHKLLSTLEK